LIVSNEQPGETKMNMGYCDCACRDCFEIAIGEAGKALCSACEEAGCIIGEGCGCEPELSEEDASESRATEVSNFASAVMIMARKLAAKSGKRVAPVATIKAEGFPRTDESLFGALLQESIKAGLVSVLSGSTMFVAVK
jgi:hypothetical protein